MVVYVYMTHKHIRWSLAYVLALSSWILYSRNGNSGHWDKGMTMISTYREQHKCNAICRSLQLDGLNDKGSKRNPLRIGFSPVRT
jgi:hypothetical protein